MKTLASLCFVAFMAVVATSSSLKGDLTQAECPPGFPIPRVDSCYFFSPTNHRHSWGNAHVSCRQKGGFLAHSRTSEEEAFLEDYFRNNYDVEGNDFNWWVGASDIDNEGTWLWEEGRELVVYNDWLPEEPSNDKGEDCMIFRKKGAGSELIFGWDDRQCSEQNLFICEIKV
ncbi:hypothetical protein TCAL_13112 [Tigriopus californicus]|uniref:C-type lectin domain-containing protein n=1 Tax=Tigriopus californicus TaxID=6832 RepID=A0A553NUW1_TIGCA|nr:perlucin-like [Tigriopus californicus]TRY69218.1 hypothetical protein TCAL_13112 [Tigriopus californicus]|eukprot:TCALIF_13112-PA protein Name:"Similar to Perlucin (Haliotis laevigata)" AED:0.33 eAED:0.39 QI:0/0/0/0.5/1/1/2/0/171